MIKLKLEKGIELPKYATEESAGLDIIANSIKKVYKGEKEVDEHKLNKICKGFEKNGYIKLRPFERILFGTGITVADMDKSLELQVRSRSGITLKRGLFVANQPGTIDADYRGEIGVIIYNSNPYLIKVEYKERIAQLVPKRIERPRIEEVEIIKESKRSSGGFGSTGN